MALVDQYVLATDTTFQQRVEQAAIEAARAISSEADSAAYFLRRMSFATRLLNNPTEFAVVFAKAVAADDAVATAAGSPPVQALVTDAQINGAVSAIWNALAGARVQ